MKPRTVCTWLKVLPAMFNAGRSELLLRSSARGILTFSLGGTLFLEEWAIHSLKSGCSHGNCQHGANWNVLSILAKLPCWLQMNAGHRSSGLAT